MVVWLWMWSELFRFDFILRVVHSVTITGFADDLRRVGCVSLLRNWFTASRNDNGQLVTNSEQFLII